MNENPKISVIMSVYKEPVEWLHQSIDSILCQTFNDFEFIIISDNPSYSEGNALLKDYADKDKRIIVVFNENNIGLTKSLNKGLAIAKGEYIARMDADDVSLPERLEEQVEFLEKHQEIGVCGCIIEYIGNRSGIRKLPEKMEEMFLFLESPFAHPTVIMRRVLCGETIKYDEDYAVSQDYALWTHLYKKGVVFYNIQKPLLKYRVNDQQIMSQKGHIQRKLSCVIRRKAMDYYFEKTHSQYRLEDKPMTMREKGKVLENIVAPQNIKAELKYYLYNSISVGLLCKLWNLVLDGGMVELPLGKIARIIKYQLKGIDESKF